MEAHQRDFDGSKEEHRKGYLTWLESTTESHKVNFYNNESFYRDCQKEEWVTKKLDSLAEYQLEIALASSHENLA